MQRKLQLRQPDRIISSRYSNIELGKPAAIIEYATCKRTGPEMSLGTVVLTLAQWRNFIGSNPGRVFSVTVKSRLSEFAMTGAANSRYRVGVRNGILGIGSNGSDLVGGSLG
jgi:hypothetical protein